MDTGAMSPIEIFHIAENLTILVYSEVTVNFFKTNIARL